jgi:hypothetical protein
MLDAVEVSYSSSPPKRVLIPTPRKHGSSLTSEAQAILLTAVQGYYKARRTADVARFAEELHVTFQVITRGENRSKQAQAPGEEHENDKTSTKRIRGTEKTVQRKGKIPRYQKPHNIRGRTKKSSQTPRMLCVLRESPNDKFPKANITVKCDHENSVCAACIAASIDAQVDIGQFCFITCPMCSEHLLPEDVRQLSGGATFERFDAILSNASSEVMYIIDTTV